ncbi:MAG: hypothetical protein PHI97_33195 [Desulfobulbus sp.]|nr:hypothetical protein [Desulfobulbus sp.]
MKNVHNGIQEMNLNPEQIEKQVQDIVLRLTGMGKKDVMQILSASMYIIAAGEPPPKNILDMKGLRSNPNLIRKSRGGVSPIDADQEVKAYILGIDSYMTISQIHEALVKKFGKKRGFSESSIHRFLQRVNPEK